MLKVNSKQLKELIESYYDKKIALFCWGSFGIGKSQVTEDTAKSIALRKNKVFVNWIETTKEQKEEVFNNPEKYFVLIDIRLSEYDSSDIKGLPVFSDNKESINFKVPFWALFVEKAQSDGILLFDEVNLAPPLVVSSCYKIIYDRVINESKINNNWLVMGCGNLSSDRSFTHELAPPLRDRGGEVELISDTDEWLNWATQDRIGIRSEIIGFIGWKPSSLRHIDFEDEQKFTTQRGWERINILLKGMEINKSNYDKVKIIVSSAIGEGIAVDFVSYCKINEQINLDDLIKNPSKLRQELKDRGVDVRYFISTAVAEKYKDKKIDFKKVVDVSREFDAMNEEELVAYMWNLCSRYSKKFNDDFVKSLDTELCEKYAKFLM